MVQLRLCEQGRSKAADVWTDCKLLKPPQARVIIEMRRLCVANQRTLEGVPPNVELSLNQKKVKE